MRILLPHTFMMTIALLGAGGKMGCRVTDHPKAFMSGGAKVSVGS